MIKKIIGPSEQFFFSMNVEELPREILIYIWALKLYKENMQKMKEAVSRTMQRLVLIKEPFLQPGIFDVIPIGHSGIVCARHRTRCVIPLPITRSLKTHHAFMIRRDLLKLRLMTRLDQVKYGLRNI
jgi:hypothetical protein